MAVSRSSTSTSAIIARMLVLTALFLSGFRGALQPAAARGGRHPLTGWSDLDRSAVDEVLGAGDEGALRPGEERGQRRHFFGAAHAPQRDVRGQRAVELFGAHAGPAGHA